MRQQTEREYYTVAEAARALDVSPATVWRWIEAQRLPAYRVGPRRIRVLKDDVERVIQPARGEAATVDKEAKRQDIFSHYDVARARQALIDSAGALAGVDRETLRADLLVQREQHSAGRPD